MEIEDNKMIAVPISIHRRIKILSAMTGRKMYKLIEESAEYLEEKYKES